MKVLVVDDEPLIRETVERKLRRDGYTVFTAESAEEAAGLFKRVSPELIVLDIMLPNRSGYELCKRLRAAQKDVPIIFISAKDQEMDKVRGLDLGGDDYLTKPFSLAELSARIKSVLRRSAPAGVQPVLESGGLRLDARSHSVSLDGNDLALSRREFALLELLMRNSGQVFTRDRLLDRLWGEDAWVTPRTIDVHVRWLRQKIGAERIVTVRGVGYRFAG